jgi:hypothetical protein
MANRGNAFDSRQAQRYPTVLSDVQVSAPEESALTPAASAWRPFASDPAEWSLLRHSPSDIIRVPNPHKVAAAAAHSCVGGDVNDPHTRALWRNTGSPPDRCSLTWFPGCRIPRDSTGGNNALICFRSDTARLQEPSTMAVVWQSNDQLKYGRRSLPPVRSAAPPPVHDTEPVPATPIIAIHLRRNVNRLEHRSSRAISSYSWLSSSPEAESLASQVAQPIKNFQRFMKPQGSSTPLKEPSRGLCPEPHQSNPYHPIPFPKTHLDIVHPTTSWSS